jgi:uncharacterized damage-inducible protein DinB
MKGAIMSCPFCNKDHGHTFETALKGLAATPRKLERLTSGLAARRAAAKPGAGKWSVKDIVCHLADCELVYGVRYRKILAEENVTLMPFDQDAWAKSLYGRGSLKDSLAVFKALRAAHIRLLQSVPRADRAKAGMHPDYGVLTLEQIVVHLADHDKNHVAQIAARIGKK